MKDQQAFIVAVGRKQQQPTRRKGLIAGALTGALALVISAHDGRLEYSTPALAQDTTPAGPSGTVQVDRPKSCLDGERDECVQLANQCGTVPYVNRDCAIQAGVNCWRELVIAMDQLRTAQSIDPPNVPVAQQQLDAARARALNCPQGRPYTGSAVAATPAGQTTSKFPKRFQFHADENNSMLDGGRHAWSDLTISASGRADLFISVENKVLLAGYCFQSNYFFRDAAGNILYNQPTPQMCVDGKGVPFTSSSKRSVHYTMQVPSHLMPMIDNVTIVHGPGSKNPMELLQNAVQKGVGIYRIVAAAM